MTTRTDAPHASSHDSHDRLVIAARAAGDLNGPERVQADHLLETCPACRVLHDQLATIAAATRRLPAPARPPALDYRISADRAAALSRGAVWRRILRPFGRSGSGAVRPLAAAFTTLGLAGLMLAALPTLQLGASTGAFLATTVESEAPEPPAGQTFEPDVALPGDASSPIVSERDTVGGEDTIDPGSGFSNANPTADDKGAGPTEATTAQGGGSGSASTPGTESDGRTAGVVDGPPGTSPLVPLSAVLLGAGLGLLLLRQVALRIR
jgi:hypothetical protein